MAAEISVAGFDVLAAQLRAITPALRKRVVRNALAAGARLVRDDAKRRAPVLQLGRTSPYRKPGTVKKAIKVRTSKRDRSNGDVGVFVNVKPNNKGAKSPDDPYYWRWLEFGYNAATGKRGKSGKYARRQLNKSGAPKTIRGIGFLKASAGKFGAALEIIERSMATWFDKTNTSGKVQE